VQACRRARPAPTPPPGKVSTLKPAPTPTSLPGSARCSATTATTCPQSGARDVKGPLPKVLDDDSDKDHGAVAHALAAGGQGGVKTLDLPQPPARTRARSRWWAFRCRRASMWWRSPRKSWAPRCWMTPWRRAHHVRAHLGAGHQPGRALQAGARKRGWPGSPRWTRANRWRAPRCACRTAAATNWPGHHRRAGHGHASKACRPRRRCTSDDDYGEGGRPISSARAMRQGWGGGHGLHLERLAARH
jgi:hypothetical protein